tara:strand:+ start:3604 stop:3723 length:120 start_codon:yes stop_codon:yes gene_type:complete
MLFSLGLTKITVLFRKKYFKELVMANTIFFYNELGERKT